MSFQCLLFQTCSTCTKALYALSRYLPRKCVRALTQGQLCQALKTDGVHSAAPEESKDGEGLRAQEAAAQYDQRRDKIMCGPFWLGLVRI